jgi:hypothetical protein
MATTPALGQGKLQLGPAVLFALLDIPWLQVGGLAQVLWSVAGSSQFPSLAYATIEPLMTVLLPGDCSVFTNDTMSFYWEEAETTVPINWGFGHGFSERFVGQLQGAKRGVGNRQEQLPGHSRAELSTVRAGREVVTGRARPAHPAERE